MVYTEETLRSIVENSRRTSPVAKVATGQWENLLTSEPIRFANLRDYKFKKEISTSLKSQSREIRILSGNF